MRIFYYKYNLIFILILIFGLFITSCFRKHKFEKAKIELSDKKMLAILTDIFLMESYVNEKMPNTHLDSLTLVKSSLYNSIFKYHKADSSTFYSTFNYYQTHPKLFLMLLTQLDSIMNKITPLDSNQVTNIVVAPANVEKANDFNEQERLMRVQYISSLKDSSRIYKKNKKK